VIRRSPPNRLRFRKTSLVHHCLRHIAVGATLLLFASNALGQTTSNNPDIDKVEAMNAQILALYRQGQYSQALDLAIKALQFAEETLGPESSATADCLNDLGGMYQNMGNYTNAEAMFKRGLEIREKVLGPEHPFTARNLNNLGVLYTLMGRYTNAEPLLQRALAINEKVVGPESRATAVSLSSLGNLYQAVGDYTRSAVYAERVLVMARDSYGPNSTETATAMNNLAVMDIYMGAYGKAEPLLQQVLAIQEKLLGPDHPYTGRTLQALGTVYSYMGDFAKSESYYQRALDVQEKNPGPDHPDTARTLAALGMLYMDMGDYGKALPMYLRALQIQEKVLGPQHPDVANTLGKLAGLYEKSGNWAQADELDQRVLSIDEKVLGPEHPETAVALMNLGALYERMGDLPKAESYDKQALAIQEKVLGPEHPDVAASLNNLASVYLKMGDADKAVPLFRRSLEIDKTVLGPDHPTTALHLANIATVYFDLHQTNEALAYADEAERSRLDLLENILSFTSEQQRLNYEAQIDPYVIFASLNDASRTAMAVLRHKGVVLDSLLEDQVVALASHDPEDQKLIEQLGPAKQQLMQLLITAPKDFKPETLQSRADMRDRLSRQIEELQGELAQKVAGFGRARGALTVTVQQVQKSIPAGASLVEFIYYDRYLGHQQWEKSYGAVVIASTGSPKWACLGSAANLGLNVLALQQAVRDSKPSDEVKLSKALHRLYDQMWKPLEALFPKDTKIVIISPDGALNFVSFATLLTSDDRFLAQKYSVRYVASGRDLLRKTVKSSSQNMVVFAAPDYTAGGQTAPAETGLQLVPLPYFAKNAADLEVQAGKWDWPVAVYSGTNATESKVRGIRSPRILHFSTHGFFLPEAIKGPDPFSISSLSLDANHSRPRVILINPMYRSGIALAGAQVTLDAWQRGEVPPTDNDGILTAEEVGSLDLQGTWLVVLSACDTGVGQSRFGEGVMGLRRGFVQAGAQNLLMTLWPVYDVPSGELMLNFYSKLHEDNNPPEALAEVQRDALVNLRSKYGLPPAVVMAGAFIVNSQGSEPLIDTH
jgi:tetratricopeptide (TPR) repeat protein/CHAT domain-containing protein